LPDSAGARPGSVKCHRGLPTNAALAPYTDAYFRGFDHQFPDYYRFKEFEREIDTNYSQSGLPMLSLVRLAHDHTGNFGTAIDMVNSREMTTSDRAIILQPSHFDANPSGESRKQRCQRKVEMSGFSPDRNVRFHGLLQGWPVGAASITLGAGPWLH